jgi:hypothetical protein
MQNNSPNHNEMKLYSFKKLYSNKKNWKIQTYMEIEQHTSE